MSFLHVLVDMLIGLLPIPKVAKDIIKLILDTSLDFVEGLTSAQYKHLTGEEKRKFVISQVAEVIDENFDDVPFWKRLSEERRDRLIAGVVEWALLIDDAASNGTTDKATRVQRRAEHAQRKAQFANKRVELIDAVLKRKAVLNG